MTAIQHYQFNVVQIRVVAKNGEPWFVASDVCAALELGNTADTIKRLDDDENTLDSIEGIQSGPGNPMVRLVNESGLYNLILGSRKPEAKAFKRWVTHEVLPAIRRNGAYALMEQEKEGLPQLATWNGLPTLLDAADPVALKLGLDSADARHMKLRLIEYVSGVIFADTLPSSVQSALVDTPYRSARRRIHQLVSEAGAKGMPKAQLTRFTQMVDRKNRDRLIQELVEAGLIAAVEQQGRAPTLYPAHLAPVPA
ncbi:MAG: Bro-N domain-containing protein [Candidatus Hydrogenedentales bacterium]|jgi:prophage antirepressor-like protein